MTDIFDLIFNFWVGFAVLSIVLVKSSIKFVPQNRAYVVERFGKYNKTMEAGLNFLLPFIDRVGYDRSLKEHAYDVPSQAAITRDNISLVVDGVLYLKVLDPYKASYGVDDYVYAVTQLAQTTMRSEIGKIELDKTFEEREVLNTNIVASINEASGPWGVQVLRYEIKDIEPPRTVLEASVKNGRSSSSQKESGSLRSMWLKGKSVLSCWQQKPIRRSRSCVPKVKRRRSSRWLMLKQRRWK